MNKKIFACKSCGNELLKNAKICPSCGMKNRKPFYKRTWFIVLFIIILIGSIGSPNDDSTPYDETTTQDVNDQTQEPEKEIEDIAIAYEKVTVDTLMDILTENALNAETSYNDKYLEITGRLSTIDSDGKYISLLPIDNDWAFMGVQCYIENDKQLAKVIEMSVDDTIVLSGQITDIGEIMGYSLKIHTIN